MDFKTANYYYLLNSLLYYLIVLCFMFIFKGKSKIIHEHCNLFIQRKMSSN